jgi:hypothetical protein
MTLQEQKNDALTFQKILYNFWKYLSNVFILMK